MARYIDADDEIRKWCVLNCGCEPCECGHTFEENGTEGCTLVDFINDQPTADVVEVVRCKDCKWFELDSFCGSIIVAHEICRKWGRGCKTSQDGFCFIGERREDGSNQMQKM